MMKWIVMSQLTIAHLHNQTSIQHTVFFIDDHKLISIGSISLWKIGRCWISLGSNSYIAFECCCKACYAIKIEHCSVIKFEVHFMHFQKYHALPGIPCVSVRNEHISIRGDRKRWRQQQSSGITHTHTPNSFQVVLLLFQYILTVCLLFLLWNHSISAFDYERRTNREITQLNEMLRW